MATTTPTDDERTAYQVAALPTEYGKIRVTQLFTRGFERYIVDGEDQPGDLLDDLERFGTAAFKDDVRDTAAREPFVDEPGTLAVLATLSAICIKAHPKFEDVPPRKIQPLYDVRELYVNNLGSLMRAYGDGALQQDIADVLYAKDPGEDGPHPGRVCTGIREMPEFDGGLYLEIPMAAASRQCLVRDEPRPSDVEGNTEIRTRVKDNNLYVPAGDFDEKYEEYAREAFKKLLRVQEDGLTEEQETWLVANESAITERIDRFLEGGNHDRVWRDWDRGERLVRVLQEAVTNADDEMATVGAFHSAQALYDALDTYKPEASWKQSIQNRVSSPRSLGNLLVAQRDHRRLTVEHDRETNQYRIDASSRGSHPITVESIEDLFELPCMANMAERLQEKTPVRKDLYNFVRMVMWLPQYQESSLDEIVTDLKDVFSQWPWYDEQTTEYQIRYEFSNTIDGEIPLPMNCDNDALQRYCIGQDQCDYSIWGSVPFPDEMYDQLDGTDSTSEF